MIDNPTTTPELMNGKSHAELHEENKLLRMMLMDIRKRLDSIEFQAWANRQHAIRQIQAVLADPDEDLPQPAPHGKMME